VIKEGKELNDVICAAYKMGCEQTREVYQRRIEKLEAALREIAMLGYWDGDRAMGIASKALEGK
jgi:hypothetical protein